jgi:dihydrofolate reductase
MHTVLHLATSTDGFIARPDGDSSWVSPVDEKLFVERVQKAGCVVIGKRTFEQYYGTMYPIPNALNLVLTSDTHVAEIKGSIVAHSPAEAVAFAEKKGYQRMLIAGGAKTAWAFLEEGLVNEIFLSVHPIKLREGMKPFDDLSKNSKYKLVETKSLSDGITEEHYVMV